MNKKMRERLDKLRFVGYFTAKEASEKGMRLVTGRNEFLCLYWLVDESDGIIADAKFQAFGAPHLIAAADVISELVLRKNYDQASRLTADLIDAKLRDRKDIPSFSQGNGSFLNQVLLALDKAVHQCIDIPYAATDFDTTPIYSEGEIERVPNFDGLGVEQKIHIIKEVIDKEVRPYIELDAGGVTVHELKENEVHISYEGACTTCHSSTGSTLNAIQGILRNRLSPQIVVVPIL